jgi:E3 ubiquitin-protein ligase SIAH1
MDDIPRAVDEDLLKELECPVCMEYMVPPIKLCTNGHTICSKCKERVQRCPTCRVGFSETRSVALENIVRRQKYPCANRESGCLQLLSIEHIAEHHAVCVYGKIKCPFHFYMTCSWNGLRNDLKEHAKAAHPDNFFEVSSFISTDISAGLEILSCFGQLFTYYQKARGNTFYCAVQLIITSSEASKYKCKFTLRAENGIEQISNTFLVRGHSEDFETIFNSGKCLKLDRDTIKHFVKKNELKLKVKLSTV